MAILMEFQAHLLLLVAFTTNSYARFSAQQNMWRHPLPMPEAPPIISLGIPLVLLPPLILLSAVVNGRVNLQLTKTSLVSNIPEVVQLGNQGMEDFMPMTMHHGNLVAIQVILLHCQASETFMNTLLSLLNAK
jgi:hypothetical protein